MTTVALPTTKQQVGGILVQMVLLAALTPGAGLGPGGWLAGIGYTLGLCALLTAAVRRAGVSTLGPADLVTLIRAVLVGGVTALVADGLWNGHTAVAPFVVIATTALVLDGVDGLVARRTGTASALGARFDMEVDAFLVLVLSVHAAVLLGPWVLAIGAMRYAFVAASWMAPWLRAALPARYSAKAVAALQGIVLVIAASEVLPRPLTAGLVSMALALLVWSFGRDVAWLWRNRPRPRGTDDQAPGGGGPGGPRRIGTHLVTVLACLLVFVVLVAPNDVGRLTPGAFLRIPVEGLLGVGLILILPPRARRVTAALGGAALGLLIILKIVDLGFAVALDRPFHPVYDWSLLEAAAGFVAQSFGQLGAYGAVATAVLVATAVIVLMTRSALRVSSLVAGHRSAAIRAVAVLAPVWVVCAVLGAQLVPGVPLAARSTASFVYLGASQVRAAAQDRKAFATEAAVDTYRDTPGESLLTALRGKDVVVSFVESYGRVAVEDPEIASRVGAVLDDGTRRLNAAGFASRSAFLTSPTAGGASWLAHATFLSGVWINNQQRYTDLPSTGHLTLPSAFWRAGWRTVGVMPGLLKDWPESAFYGYQRVRDSQLLGYRGPHFGFGSMPDQYILSAFERLEHAQAHRPPVMAEIALVSSHAPWTARPRLVGWDQVGDGSVFDSMAGPSEDMKVILTRDPAVVRADYRESIAYTLSSLISYVETYGDDHLVLVFLGDHQPAPVVTGDGASWDVPITIVTRDRAVLDRIAGWGWQDGLKPDARAPVWRMDAFRDRFLAAFGP